MTSVTLLFAIVTVLSWGKWFVFVLLALLVGTGDELASHWISIISAIYVYVFWLKPTNLLYNAGLSSTTPVEYKTVGISYSPETSMVINENKEQLFR